MNPFAALYNFWVGVPIQIRGPLKSALYSYWLSVENTTQGLAFGFVAYAALAHWDWTLSHFLEYVRLTWFAYCYGAWIAVRRAKEEKGRVDNTVQLPSGATATLLTPPKDGTVYPLATQGPPP